jgi:hypothetical protein
MRFTSNHAAREYESKIRLAPEHNPGYVVFTHESGKLYLNADDTAEIAAVITAAAVEGTPIVKVEPDDQDFAEVERAHGRLPANATTAEHAHRYRLAIATKLARLHLPDAERGR